MKLHKHFFLGLIILVSCQKQDMLKQEALIFNGGPVIVTGQIENARLLQPKTKNSSLTFFRDIEL